MWSIVQAAGWPIWFLIIASVITVALILERVRALRASQVLSPLALNDAVALVDSGDTGNREALGGLIAQGSVGAVLAAGARGGGMFFCEIADIRTEYPACMNMYLSLVVSSSLPKHLDYCK